MSIQKTSKNELCNYVDSEWKPVQVATTKSLVKEITSKEFQTSLAGMLEDFEKIIPKEYDSSGRSFVPMSEKYRLLETHFPFGAIRIFTQFISHDTSNAICIATIYVLTEEGYEPWFSRMGMGNIEGASTDGALADAETSASRRILIGLGLGYEGVEEIAENNELKNVQGINNFLAENNKSMNALVEDYIDQHSRYGLKLLSQKYLTSNGKKLSYNDIHKSDIKRLLSFIASVNNSKD